MEKQTRMVVLARVIERLGMDEKTSKGYATRQAGKLGIIKDDNGFVTEAEALSVLKSIADSKGSKYSEAAHKLLKAGIPVDEKLQKASITSQKGDTFAENKAYRKLMQWCIENDYQEIPDQFNVFLAEVEEEKAKRKQ